MRITNKKLIELVNNLFEKVEFPFSAFEVIVTRYRPYDYEGGAVKQIIKCKNPNGNEMDVYCFYSKKELENDLNAGCRLVLKSPYLRHNIYQWELDLKS